RRHTRFSRDWSSDVCSSDLDADPSDGYLRIAVENPDAFICVFTYEEVLEIHIEPDATWAGGIASSYEASLTASVDPAWTGGAGRLSVREAAATDGSFAGSPEAFRLLDSQEYADRAFPSFTGFYDYDEDPRRILLEVDITDGGVVGETEIDPALGFANFTPWRP